MKKLYSRFKLILITILLSFFINVHAQNIVNKIGGTGENDEFQISNSSDEVKFVVQGDGNVGVGTTSPSYKLDVAGDINCTGNIYQNGSSFGSHYIGELYGGGIVIFVYENGQHGLITSLDDIDGGSGVQWYNGSEITTNATSTWDGESNSTSIISVQGAGTYAAQLCQDYSGGDQTDWYLPSIYELTTIFNNAFIINKILESDSDPTTNGMKFREPIGVYWSSTEIDNQAIEFNTDRGNYYNSPKSELYRVRAIRQF